MATKKHTRNRIKLAAVLALGTATMPLNGCDAGAIMGIIQAVAPIAQQLIGQIAANNGGGSSALGGTSSGGNSSGGTTSPFATSSAGGSNQADQTGLTTDQVADAAVNDNGGLDKQFEGQTTKIDGKTADEAVKVVEGASAD